MGVVDRVNKKGQERLESREKVCDKNDCHFRNHCGFNFVWSVLSCGSVAGY